MNAKNIVKTLLSFINMHLSLILVGVVVSLIFFNVKGCKSQSQYLSIINDLKLENHSKETVITKWVDKYDKEHSVVMQNKMTGDVARILYKDKFDSVSRLLGIRENQIRNYQMFATVTHDTVIPDIYNIINNTCDSFNKFTFSYDNSYLGLHGTGTVHQNSVSGIKIDYLHSDSLTYVQYDKRPLFGRSKSFVDISMSDPHSKITGVSQIVVVEKPKRWGAGLQGGYGLSFGLPPRPTWYIGVGLSYNVVRW